MEQVALTTTATFVGFSHLVWTLVTSTEQCSLWR